MIKFNHSVLRFNSSYLQSPKEVFSISELPSIQHHRLQDLYDATEWKEQILGKNVQVMIPETLVVTSDPLQLLNLIGPSVLFFRVFLCIK